MPEKMCPLMSIATGLLPQGDMYAKSMQHKCAWFDDVMGQCICARNINPFQQIVMDYYNKTREVK
jgi:hypothetical protein